MNLIMFECVGLFYGVVDVGDILVFGRLVVRDVESLWVECLVVLVVVFVSGMGVVLMLLFVVS